MKLALSLRKFVIVACFSFFTLLYSCHRHMHKSENVFPEIIQIADGDIISGKLTLKDLNEKAADTFKVHAGNSVKWILGNNQAVERITNIYKKPGSPTNEVFSQLPDSIGGSKNWQGKIDKSAAGKVEDYNIDWIDKDGNPHTYDPRIQVKS